MVFQFSYLEIAPRKSRNPLNKNLNFVERPGTFLSSIQLGKSHGISVFLFGNSASQKQEPPE